MGQRGVTTMQGINIKMGVTNIYQQKKLVKDNINNNEGIKDNMDINVVNVNGFNHSVAA